MSSLKKLGYKDYESLVNESYSGYTIIDPNTGVLNTRLIEAGVVITSKLLADTIMANELNINDRFKIYTNGNVDMNGVFHSLGANTELVLSNGYLKMLYNGVDSGKAIR